jgi:hypothetical protein
MLRYEEANCGLDVVSKLELNSDLCPPARSPNVRRVVLVHLHKVCELISDWSIMSTP